MPTRRRQQRSSPLLHFACRARSRSQLRLTALLVLTTSLTACFRPNPNSSALITELRADSTTSVVVAFDQPVQAIGDELTMFEIKAASGAKLEIVAVHGNSDGTRFVVATYPQEATTYTLKVGAARLVAAAGALEVAARTFAGSDLTAPVVASAVAVSNTSLVVTLHDPEHAAPASLSSAALAVDEVRIVASNGTRLEVESIKIGRAHV